MTRRYKVKCNIMFEKDLLYNKYRRNSVLTDPNLLWLLDQGPGVKIRLKFFYIRNPDHEDITCEPGQDKIT